MMDSSTLPVPMDTGAGRVSTLAQLAQIPEEEIWLQSRRARAPDAPRTAAPPTVGGYHPCLS
jgi:hypothetical protein